MDKEKEYVCGYPHCKHNGVKVPSNIGIKDGTRYYHEDCYQEKEQKNQIIEMYYKHSNSKEELRFVNSIISQLIYKDFYTSDFILFALCQAVKKKIPFKSIYTLRWLVKNDQQIMNNYTRQKANSKVSQYKFEYTEVVEETINQIPQKNKSSWGDTLFL